MAKPKRGSKKSMFDRYGNVIPSKLPPLTLRDGIFGQASKRKRKPSAKRKRKASPNRKRSSKRGRR